MKTFNMAVLNPTHARYFLSLQQLADYMMHGGLVQNMHNPDYAYRIVMIYDRPTIERRSLRSNHWYWSAIGGDSALDELHDLKAIQPLGLDPDMYNSCYRPNGSLNVDTRSVKNPRFDETFFQMVKRVMKHGTRGEQPTTAGNRRIC